MRQWLLEYSRTRNAVLRLYLTKKRLWLKRLYRLATLTQLVPWLDQDKRQSVTA